MGIRFDCPNGHTLNVKSFLAGKKGICPTCGAKFRIPAASDTSDDGSEADMGPPPEAGKKVIAPMAGAPPVVTVPKSAATVPQPAPAAKPATVVTAVPQTAIPTGSAVPVVTPVVPTSSQPGNLADAMRAAAAASAPGGAAGDAISEAPTAIWYVRPPSGGQYGPARGDVMRQWVSDGRVTPPSLVWREGWTDWRVASDVFPSLGGGSGLPGVAGDAAPVDPVRTTRKTANYLAKRKSSNTLAMGGIIILVLLVVGLVVALAVVMSQTKG